MPLENAINFANWFVFQDDRLLLTQNPQGRLPSPQQLLQLNKNFLRHFAVGQFNQIDCYCAEIATDIALPHDVIAIPLKKSFEILGHEWFVAATKSYSVINWDKNHRFCGRCGSKTIHKVGVFERICTHCQLVLYPRISPSMIVLIKRDDTILMARSPHFPPGVFGLIAGFVEMGESIEDTVHREVHEEVGIQVKNLQYFGSQSWPFPDALMIGFIADYAMGELKIDNIEIEQAGWYHYTNLPGRPSSKLSIAGRLLDHYIAEQTEPSKRQ
ncbi:MAG: NAD(+) diphosphatase [Gammaproteobacteria bacterium]|nr:NAD(+) diphosphatase [Gammaproteobacteria bacterium]